MKSIKNLTVHSENKYLHLLVILLLFFAIFPFIEHIEENFLGIALLFFLSIILTLRALKLGKRTFLLCVSFGGVALLLGLFSSFIPGGSLRHVVIAVSLVIFALFMLASIIFMNQKMFYTNRITGDVIRGGISLYLLLGYLWTIFYYLIYHFDPFAFHSVSPWQDSNLFYFSFTTLTTLGYGDINPVNKIAMALAGLEAIVAQLYLTIFVARIVGMHIIFQSHPRIIRRANQSK